MCSKYHACHTKSRLNSTPRSLDVLFTLRKAIQRKLHVLKVPRLSHKVTIQHFSKARFHRKTQSTAPPQHAPARENRRFTTVSRDRHARSYERVARARAKIDVLLQFRAIDTHDPTKGLRAPAPKSTFYYSFARSTHTRFHVKHKVSQAFSGPGRP